MEKGGNEKKQGLAVDAYGDSVVDPTKNVLQLVEAAVTRLNDIRTLESLLNEKIRQAEMKRLDDLRESDRKRNDEIQVMMKERTDDLREAEVKRVNEKFADMIMYQNKLTEAEAKRLDAIRAVDAQAIQTSSEKASAQALVLATQVATSNDTLRNLVAQTATNISDTLKATTTAITERLLVVERAQYESRGKEGMTEPMIQKLIDKVTVLAEGKAAGTGETKGKTDMWGYIIGAAGLAAIIWKFFGG